MTIDIPRVLASASFVTALTVAFVAAHGQQRDATPLPTPVVTGTGQISGVLVSDDTTPRPIRRAIVTISGGGMKSGRSVLTDDDGKFSFSRLPAGNFAINAKKAAYLAADYGAMKPGRPGTDISLADGQRVTITLTMVRGAVMTGTIRDQNGAPISAMTVQALNMKSAGAPDNPASESTTTDDRGMYRFYGLMPGEYVVLVTPRENTSGGTLINRGTPEMDALLAALAQRHPSGAPASSAGSAPPPFPLSPPIGFAPVFYPGTAFFLEAGRLRLAPGEERTGVDLQVAPMPVATISGMVNGDVVNLASVQLNLLFSGPRNIGTLSSFNITGQPMQADGRFTYGNVAPGPLRIIAKARRGASDPANPGSGSGRGGGQGASFTTGAPVAGTPGPVPVPTAAGEMLFGVIDVDVRGQDVNGLSILLQPGGILSGRLAFDTDRTPIPTDMSKFVVGVQQPGGTYAMSNGSVTSGNNINQVGSVAVKADGTFEITSIGPTGYTFYCQMPADLSAVWKLRSAMVDGRDLMDGLVEVLPGGSIRNVTLTLSDKKTEIGGTLQTSTGQPATDYYIVVLPADRALWKSGARRLRQMRPSTDGKFTFPDLPPGTYILAALTDLDPNDWTDPAILEQIVPAGVKITLVEGERKVQDLKIGR